MDIVGYTRLSRATEESTSITRQRTIITETVARRGDTLVGIEEDPESSATKRRLDRPGLNRARERIHAGEAQALMVWRLDRLARSVGDFMAVLDSGVEIISATEPIDTTSPMGRAMAQVLQVFAELEARTTGLRVASSQAHLRRTGRFPGGRPPYGYRIVPHPEGAGKALEPDPEEAAVVQRVAADILGGSSLYRATRALNADGVLTRDGKAWNSRSLARILLNGATLGRVNIGDDVRRDERGLPVEVWEPILSPGDVARIRAAITTGPSGPRRKRSTRLLSGIMTCDGCEGILVVRERHSATGRPVYGCRAGARGLICEVGAHIDAEKAEEVIEAEFLARFGIFRMTEVIESAPDSPERLIVEEAIIETTRSMASPEADLAGLMERLVDLRDERDRIAAEPPSREHVVVETDRTFAEEWAGADLAGRRRLLLSAGTRVRVGPSVRGRWTPERLKVSFRGL